MSTPIPPAASVSAGDRAQFLADAALARRFSMLTATADVEVGDLIRASGARVYLATGFARMGDDVVLLSPLLGHWKDALDPLSDFFALYHPRQIPLGAVGAQGESVVATYRGTHTADGVVIYDLSSPPAAGAVLPYTEQVAYIARHRQEYRRKIMAHMRARMAQADAVEVAEPATSAAPAAAPGFDSSTGPGIHNAPRPSAGRTSGKRMTPQGA
jgi:hypothetical protein